VTTITDEFEEQLDAVIAKLQRVREMNDAGDPAAVDVIDETNAELNALADMIEGISQHTADRLRVCAGYGAEAAELARKQLQQ
jgi:septation ring formation regulator EzrA